MIKISNNETLKLQKLKLHEDKNGEYYLSASYIQDNDFGTYRLDIPKISLPINRCSLMIRDSNPRYCGRPECIVDIGFGETIVVPINDVAYTVTTLHEKTKKMTISEIEKKLGHKVEIIAE